MTPRTPALVLLGVACAFAGCKPAKDQPEDPAAKPSPAAAVSMASPPLGAVVSPGVAPPDRGVMSNAGGGVMSNAGGGVMSNAGGGVMSNAGGGLRPPVEGVKRPGSPAPKPLPRTALDPGRADEAPGVAPGAASDASAAPAALPATPAAPAASPAPAVVVASPGLVAASPIAASPKAGAASPAAIAASPSLAPSPAPDRPTATPAARASAPAAAAPKAPSATPATQVASAPRSHVFTVAGTFGGAMLVLVARDGAAEYRGTVQAVSRTARIVVPEGRTLQFEVRNGLSGKRLAGPLEVVVPPGDDVVPLAF